MARVVQWFCLSLLTASVLVGLYHALAERPTTPMTVAQSERLFGDGLAPGQCREEVEAWLVSQGIPPSSATQPGRISYDISERRDDVTFKGWWMDCRGNRTVAEWAGLDVDAVYSAIRVTYPDARRPLIGWIELKVYLFFNADRRLIRHWMDEFHVSL
jgi:hypothetical protein